MSLGFASDAQIQCNIVSGRLVLTCSLLSSDMQNNNSHIIAGGYFWIFILSNDAHITNVCQSCWHSSDNSYFFCSSWVHLSKIKKSCINKIPAGVHTNAIDLQDTIVYCRINIVPGLVYLQMHSNSYKLFSGTHTLQQFTLLRYNKYNLFKVCTTASLRYNKYNLY
jgi:hypothetical protein